jgi:Skp family chaperone for outer membrane proteins
MKYVSHVVRAAVVASALALTATAFAPAVLGANAPAPGIPQPKILVIDRAAILRGSAVGQSIVKQVQGYTLQAENDLKGQGQALRAQGQALQQQIAILAPDVKAKKIAAFEAQQQALQAKAQQKQSLIQGGFLQARQQVEAALGPILQGIMAERGANMLIDRNAVVMSTVDVDVTQTAIQRLNQKLPQVKVNLTPLPPGVQPQQPQQ